MGTGSHTAQFGLPNIPAVPGTLADLKDVLIQRCGVNLAAIDVLLDPESPYEMGDAVAAIAEVAEDLLVFYYVGHGLISPNGALYLASSRTDWRSGRAEHTALAYELVRRSLLASAARTIVVILDCCYSGRDSAAGFASLAAVDGALVLTSAGRDELTLAAPGLRHTAFTGELIRVLSEGDPSAPAEITLECAYRLVAARLPAAGYPNPQYCGATRDLVLAPNPARLNRVAQTVPRPRSWLTSLGFPRNRGR